MSDDRSLSAFADFFEACGAPDAWACMEVMAFGHVLLDEHGDQAYQRFRRHMQELGFLGTLMSELREVPDGFTLRKADYAP